jgi:hypothetical protein
LNTSLLTFFSYLASCSSIHSDGTFKTAPRYFNQSYTIHGWSGDTGNKKRIEKKNLKKVIAAISNSIHIFQIINKKNYSVSRE